MGSCVKRNLIRGISSSPLLLKQTPAQSERTPAALAQAGLPPVKGPAASKAPAPPKPPGPKLGRAVERAVGSSGRRATAIDVMLQMVLHPTRERILRQPHAVASDALASGTGALAHLSAARPADASPPPPHREDQVVIRSARACCSRASTSDPPTEPRWARPLARSRRAQAKAVGRPSSGRGAGTAGRGGGGAMGSAES